MRVNFAWFWLHQVKIFRFRIQYNLLLYLIGHAVKLDYNEPTEFVRYNRVDLFNKLNIYD